tara:strand:- start:637 stop:1377 length:741 start_codon:yes stop_codon:yes gene_type:complete
MLQEILQNKIFTFLLSGLLILYIGIYKELNPHLKNTIHKKVRQPIILLLLLILCGLFSHANVVICVLLLLSILITLSTPIETEYTVNNTVNNTLNHKVNNINEVIDNEQNDELLEGFSDKKKKNPSYLQKYFNIDPEKYTNTFKEGMIENKRKRVEEKIKNQFKNNNSNSKKKNKKQKNSEIIIPKRKFDIEEQEDKNLLNTKQICHDIINRITFKYEDKPYLKKYIATRVEEMVDINNLLDEDDE